MQPLSAAGGMRAKWRDGQPMKKVAASFVKPNDRLTSFERLEIYNRQYWYRIKDCFFEDYMGLQVILGEERFEQLALAYLEKFPSESFTLRNLGRHLVEFLEANPRWTKPLQKEALNMAQLEWAHIEAFDNEARPRLRVESLTSADPASLRLKLQPHVTVLELGYEVDKLLIRAKHDRGFRNEASNAMERSRTSKRSALKRELKAKTIYLAVHRHDESVYYKRLEPAQYRLLTALRDGATLSEACDALMQSSGGGVSKVGEWFKTWAGLGWFCEPE